MVAAIEVRQVCLVIAIVLLTLITSRHWLSPTTSLICCPLGLPQHLALPLIPCMAMGIHREAHPWPTTKKFLKRRKKDRLHLLPLASQRPAICDRNWLRWTGSSNFALRVARGSRSTSGAGARHPITLLHTRQKQRAPALRLRFALRVKPVSPHGTRSTKRFVCGCF